MTKEPPNEESQKSPVGYCNPPKHTQFKKGQSGNPRGRPKGTLNMATVLERELGERVVVNKNGRRRTVTKLVALGKRLTDKAVSGDLKAIHLLASLMESAEERPKLTHPEDRAFDVRVTFEKPVEARVVAPIVQEAIDVAATAPALEEEKSEE